MSQRAYAIVVTVFAICLGVIAVTQRIELRELGFSPSEPPTENPAVERLTKLGGDAKSFVEGNIYFVAYHEVGHVLVSEFQLPVIGREEDASDRLAILLLTPEGDKETPSYLIAAMRALFHNSEDAHFNDIAWWGEHGTDMQRGFQIACLLYGANEKRFAKIADAVALPQERRETCIDEAAKNRDSWRALLSSHAYGEGELAPADAITIEYKPTRKHAAQLAHLKDIGFLEDLANLLRRHKINKGIRITADECGSPNASWDPDKRELMFCYELVADFERIAK